MWLRHLPSITSVLAVTEQFSMDKISEIVDNIFENTKSSELFIPNKENNVKGSVTKCLKSVASQLENFKLNINELQHTQTNYRWHSTRGMCLGSGLHSVQRHDIVPTDYAYNILGIENTQDDVVNPVLGRIITIMRTRETNAAHDTVEFRALHQSNQATIGERKSE